MTSTDPWVRRYREGAPDAPRLICFPHAGGAASYFYPYARALTPAIDVLAVQYPGRQDRYTEPHVQNVQELAAQITTALRPWTDRPFAFFGHSMGAILAFEVARNFQRDGAAMPDRLFVSGRRAPSCLRDEFVHRQDDRGLLDDVRTLAGTDQRLLADEEMLQMVLPTIRSDYTAIETYTMAPGPPITCPITVLIGDSDPKSTVPEARAWETHTTEECVVKVFPGGHFFLDPHRQDVLDLIVAQLTA
jgi:surfactin synthase thioesterase subunit